ncbi:MAG: cobyric acid synthase [Brachymonas sp.]|nr:cobyric acid synthase [Brachymonas sp.]
MDRKLTGPAACVMVLGCTSSAGKSWLTTALCRWYARQGYKVAPFKAQNMSNNARVVGMPAPMLPVSHGALPPEGALAALGRPGSGDVTAPTLPASHGALPPEGALAALGRPGGGSMGEIGAAQYFQALAACATPDVRMNPLLLKPESDTHSQVVLLGQVNQALGTMPWRGRSQHVWPVLAQALDALRAENDVVVIEGAGSPAEINLTDSDVVNMRVARHAGAACVLVADIDRGGAFAHLYGTWALLSETDRALLRGFVVNKFRGDASLLPPAPERLQELTGLPTLAVVPWVQQHGLPEEDGVFDAGGTMADKDESAITVAVVAWPRISNLDEFQPLKAMPGVQLQWVRSADQLQGLRAQDWIILPGSKATASDLHWLRQQGLDAPICRHAARGGRVLGVRGGLQMLGEAVIDIDSLESTDACMANAPGLGLLPLVTVLRDGKTVRQVHACFKGDVAGAWSTLAGVLVQGYEIHRGQTQAHPAMLRAGHVAQVVLADEQGQPLGWINGAAVAANPHTGNVLGLYLHGLFENAAVLQALFGAKASDLDAAFDRMADVVEQHFGANALQALLQPLQ